MWCFTNLDRCPDGGNVGGSGYKVLRKEQVRWVVCQAPCIVKDEVAYSNLTLASFDACIHTACRDRNSMYSPDDERYRIPRPRRLSSVLSSHGKNTNIKSSNYDSNSIDSNTATAAAAEATTATLKHPVDTSFSNRRHPPHEPPWLGNTKHTQRKTPLRLARPCFKGTSKHHAHTPRSDDGHVYQLHGRAQHQRRSRHGDQSARVPLLLKLTLSDVAAVKNEGARPRHLRANGKVNRSRGNLFREGALVGVALARAFRQRQSCCRKSPLKTWPFFGRTCLCSDFCSNTSS